MTARLPQDAVTVIAIVGYLIAMGLAVSMMQF